MPMIVRAFPVASLRGLGVGLLEWQVVPAHGYELSAAWLGRLWPKVKRLTKPLQVACRLGRPLSRIRL